MKHKNFIISAIIIAAVTFISAKDFNSLKNVESAKAGPGVVDIEMLSKYSPGLKGTSGDTPIYHLKGEEKGGKMLILGGTHPNEPSANISATALVESFKVKKGDVYIIPQANRSAFTHNDPQEGNLTYYTLETQSGKRKFRFGSRATNPIEQWPDPAIYIHPSGQKLSGGETRNLNRSYPGKKEGTLTEKIAYGIVNVIKTKKTDISIDLHEASPEYPVINAMVAPEKAMEIASSALMNIQMEGMDISIEPSPKNFRGLSHREWADWTDTFPFLFESANASQGRLRGASSQEQIVDGKDKYYAILGRKGILAVEFTKDGHSLTERAARHITSIISLGTAIADYYPEKEILFENSPSYDEIIENGIGSYLK